MFVKAVKKVSVLARDGGETEALVTELVARGITKRSAQKLVSHHEAVRIREKIKLFDSIKGR